MFNLSAFNVCFFFIEFFILHIFFYDTVQFFSGFLFQYFLCCFVSKVGLRLAVGFMTGFKCSKLY